MAEVRDWEMAREGTVRLSFLTCAAESKSRTKHARASQVTGSFLGI